VSRHAVAHHLELRGAMSSRAPLPTGNATVTERMLVFGGSCGFRFHLPVGRRPVEGRDQEFDNDSTGKNIKATIGQGRVALGLMV